jgi:hypothetical protein
MHHARVVVYDRTEDAPDVIETFVSRGDFTQATVSSASSRNPSSRRDGLAIKLDCEGCPARLELTIEQHKGQTFLAWREF